MYPLLTNAALNRSALFKRLRDMFLHGMHRQSAWLVAAALVLAFTLLGGALRSHAQEYGRYSHPDEEIARAVVWKVLDTGSNDTNWAHTDVSPKFRYDQYNFSSYYLFGAYAEELSGHSHSDIKHPISVLIGNLRRLSIELGTLCILLAGILGWRVAGAVTSVTAAGLTAVSVTLFQDSLYARPEAFVTALSLILLIVLTSERIHRGIVLTISGFAIGLLIACKVTFVLYVPFPILLAPAFLSTQDQGDSSNPHLVYWSASMCAYFLAMGIGFYIGAPYAVHYPWEYINGVKFLFTQYENGWWPNGLHPGSTEMERFGNGLTYLMHTVGYLALILGCFGIARLIKTRDARLALILAGPMLTLLYFLQTMAFFERNFSQALPILFVLVGLGIQSCATHLKKWPAPKHAVTAVLLGACLITPATVIAKIFHPVLDGSYARLADAGGLTETNDSRVLVMNGQFALNRLPEVNGNYCGDYIYAMRDYGDREGMSSLLAKGYRIAGWLPSVFGDEQISTLQSYFSASMLYIAPPRPASGRCVAEIDPLEARPEETQVPAPVNMSGGWSLNGAPLRIDPQQWPWPLYGSWSGADSHTGDLTIGPFRSCGDLAIPISGGRGIANLSLEITRKIGKTEETIITTRPPFALYRWEQLTLRNPDHRCAMYTIKASDTGDGWEEWLGVGAPVSLPDRVTH